MKKCLLFLLLFFFSCHLGPKYEQPITKAPSTWKNSTTTNSTLAKVENWWEIFEDTTLNDLEKKALNQNLDIFIALKRILEARAAAGVKKADLYPQVNLNPSLNNISELIELYGIPQGIVPGLKTILRVHEQEYMLPLTMSYEFDFWGKYRGQYNSANLTTQALEEALKVSMLSVSTELASSYFNLCALDTQISLYEKQIQVLNEILTFHKSRFETGITNQIDVFAAEEELSNLESDYHAAIDLRAHFENAIALLIGTIASDFHLEKKSIKNVILKIPTTLPSAILLSRPDIAEAERRLAAEHALIGVAYSSFFPSFSLTAGLGFASPELKDLFSWKARLFNFALNIVQSIFDGKRNISNLEKTKMRFQQVLGSYNKTVLMAFQEVEDSLSSQEEQSKEFTYLEKSLSSAENISNLTSQRYEKGLVNILEVLTSLRSELKAKMAVIDMLSKRYQSSISLIKALGGTWEESTIPSDDGKKMSQQKE